MKKLKISVCLSFALILGTFALLKSDHVTGQTGGTALSAPTGVTATDNLYNNKVGVFWDAIRGATNYRVFRNTTNDPSTASDVGITVAQTFFDFSAPPNQSFFYWVRAENGSAVSALSSSDQGLRSNSTQQGPVPPLDPPPVPPGNPLTATKSYLGKALFWDEQLSSSRTVSCGSCHHAGSGGTDPRSAALAADSFSPGLDGLLGTPDDVRGSLGTPANNVDGTYVFTAPYGLNSQVTGRKTVSYVDAAYAPLLFWDGRATGQFRDPITNAVILNNGGALESQIMGPPVSSTEMAHSGRTWTDVANRISASKPLVLSPSVPVALTTWINGRTYPDLFLEAFGTSDVTPSKIALAIATYERTLYSDQTPLDQVNAGIGQLTQAEQRGRNVFTAPGNNCAACHAGALGTDNAFHYDGIRPQNEDTGRFQVTGNNNNLGEFRTPSLRNVELRGSFFHNGQFTTLEQVVAFYNRGGDFNGPNKDPRIHPLNLNAQQQADLVTFLKRPFTDPRVAAELPPFDRPTLYMESSRVPQITGNGRAGSGAATPQIKAISPPLVGNPNFTVSVSNALGNSSATLVIDDVDPGVGSAIPTSGSLVRIATNTQNTGAGNGWTSVSVPIPDSSAVAGHTFFARWYVQDAAAVNGFSVSQAAQFTVFGQAGTAGPNFSVSGRVLAPDGRALRNTTVTLTDALGGVHRATTSSFGIYTIDDISTSGNCTIAISSRLYRFATQTFSLSGDLTNVDFVGLE